MQEEETNSGKCSVKKSMLEQLAEHYKWCLKMGNGGGVVGYYSEIPEKIKSEYLFTKGKFTLRRVHKRFCLWDYDPTPSNAQRYI